MAQGSFHRRRIVKKSEHWHRHGKHKPFHVTWFLHAARTRIKRFLEPMYASVREAFEAHKRNRGV